jgi:hypothetical protein
MHSPSLLLPGRPQLLLRLRQQHLTVDIVQQIRLPRLLLWNNVIIGR